MRAIMIFLSILALIFDQKTLIKRLQLNNSKAVPLWINKEFLVTALKHYKNDESVKVKHYEISCTKCETELSAKIEFVTVNNQCSETVNVLIKVNPNNNEIKMYSRTLPMIQKLFAKYGEQVKLCPELIYVTDDPVPVIFLKDLPNDTVIKPPYNEHDSKLIFQKLDNFRADAFFLAENEKEKYNGYSYTIHQLKYLVKTFFKSPMKRVAN